jgi:hypothetical protein
MSNLEKVAEYDDMVMYKTSCSCLDDDCTLTLDIEYVKELDSTILSIYQKQNWYSKEEKFKNIWARIKAGLKIIFTGWLETNSSFIFRDEEHVKDFAQTILDETTRISNISKIKKTMGEKDEAGK